MPEKKSYFLPVFVIQNPAPTVFPGERVIQYPWFTDRCGQHWAIVQAARVIEGDECLLRANQIHGLKPALIRVDVFEIDGGLAGRLGDIDGKFIARRREDFLYLTLEESIEKLRDADWVKSFFGNEGQPDQTGGSAEGLVFDLQAGLLKRKDAS